jgi:hypothetical protein
MIKSLEHEVQCEAACRMALVALPEKASHRERVRRAREWWKSVQVLLRAYSRIIAEGNCCSPPPAEIATRLADIAGDLAVGKIPALVSEVKMTGHPAIGAAELRDIRLAVAYRKACEPAGIFHKGEQIKIDDKAPIKTLIGWYGAQSKRTIQGWLENYEAADLGVNRVTSEVLIELTKRAGEHYADSRGCAVEALEDEIHKERLVFVENEELKERRARENDIAEWKKFLGADEILKRRRARRNRAPGRS